MADASPLWSAALHHFRLDTGKPDDLARFYAAGLGLESRTLDRAVTLMAGGERRLLIGPGEAGTAAYFSFAFKNTARLAAYRGFLQAKGFNLAPSPTPLFGDDGFALLDPDGRQIVFGVPKDPAGAADDRPGRLQHIVFATAQLDKAIAFYADGLGFHVSDWVREEGGEPTACFLRSDDEHHSLAVFRAPEARLDHHSYETTCWNDIRDWADHFGAMEVPLWWGPGRHGVGNNLFFMVEDPDGNKVELSAEIEHVGPEIAAREWPHGPRALNLWGTARMRS